MLGQDENHNVGKRKHKSVTNLSVNIQLKWQKFCLNSKHWHFSNVIFNKVILLQHLRAQSQNHICGLPYQPCVLQCTCNLEVATHFCKHVVFEGHSVCFGNVQATFSLNPFAPFWRFCSKTCFTLVQQFSCHCRAKTYHRAVYRAYTSQPSDPDARYQLAKFGHAQKAKF